MISVPAILRWPTPIRHPQDHQSFIKDLSGDEDSAAIVGAIITLAHRLKRKGVAEGVETVAQAALLRAYECDCS
jgi:EAL domain-containing protein (putative c-di-GMP-specific phosphodiesterase class I)